MDTNAKLKLELRNLLPGQAPSGVKCCSICGKPGSRATAEVKALEHHAHALALDLPTTFRMLTKVMGSNLVDFVQGERFNAQLESIREKLTQARMEHDAYAPEVQDKTGLKRTLVETLALIGVTGLPEDATPTALAEKLKAELEVLMAIKADAEADANGVNT